jgi:sec-independent protein translocase protein TatB
MPAAERAMLSIPHLIVIFIVALVIFGPEKIPELARNLGKVMAEFRRATGDLRNTFETHLRDLEREADEHRISAAAEGKADAPASAELPPGTPAEGTVPASAPYADVIAAGSGSVDEADSPGAPPREAASPEPFAQDPSEVNPELQEPVLFGMAIDPSVGRPALQEPPPEPKAEPNPEEKVSDGRARPA